MGINKNKSQERKNYLFMETQLPNGNNIWEEILKIAHELIVSGEKLSRGSMINSILLVLEESNKFTIPDAIKNQMIARWSNEYKLIR